MLKNLNLKIKIFFLVGIVVMASFLTATWIVSEKSTELAKRDAYILAQERAEKYKNEIKAELQGARVTSETLKTVFETLKDHGLTDRDMMNDILKNALDQKEYITAFCIAYDPGALDGKDALYAGQAPTYDETGRFAPYWNKLGGNIEVEPLYDIDVADWYIVPKETKKEYITDPYPYHVQGRDIMLASMIFPILHEGEFIGIISSDIVLDKLQGMVSGVSADGQGGFTQIFSNSGALVAHPDRTRLGEDIADPGAKAAIARGELYISSDSEYYTVYAPIRFSDETSPWSVAVSVPMAEVLANAIDVRNYVIWVFAVSILALAVLLYLIASNIAKPVLILANSARVIGEGRFDAELPRFTGSDEIGVLSRAFVVMAEKINDLIKRLQNYTHELELKNAQLTIAKELAEQSSRAKSEFLSNMSHEMRTPMNAIIGMTSIGESAGDVERKNYAFGKIKEASAHLLSVINDVLDMSKIEANKLELAESPFEFAKMLDAAIHIVSFEFGKKRQRFSKQIGEGIPNVLIGDERRLAQVITNLLSNAAKFTEEEGDIRLEARLVEEADGLCALEVVVTDTGIGLSEEQQMRLFTAFEQADSGTSRKFGGTGLGLAISKRIVQMMGGDIRVDSKLGEGAAFIFTVRLMKGEIAEVGLKCEPTGAEIEEDFEFAGHCILLAEDVEINREIVLALLESTGLEIDCAENGAEALRMYSEHPGRYSAVLMDVQMPEMDGLDATRRIRALTIPGAVTVPIIAMTANVFKEDVERCLDAGMNGHIGKPLELDQVMGMLRKYLVG